MKEHMAVQEKDLALLAQKTLEYLNSQNHGRAKVVLLEGDLGSGKTTFTQALAKELGVEEPIQSPTFVLKRSYLSPHANFKKLVHVDAYRFNDPKEARTLRLSDEIGNHEALLVIEWPSKMGHMQHDLKLSFDVIDEDTRGVTMSYEERG